MERSGSGYSSRYPLISIVFRGAQHRERMTDMLYTEDHIGRIMISDTYLRQLTEQTVLQCFGIAGFAEPTFADKLFEGRFSPVEIDADGNKLEITVHVKVIYGVNMPAVIHALMHKIEFVVQETVRVPVSRVRVFVDEVVER